MGEAMQIPADQAGEWERKAQRVAATGETPHFAPDPEVLAIFWHRLQATRNGTYATALVLGATPELADLALESGLRVAIVDRSQSMLDASLARRRTVDPAREKPYLADWGAMSMIADSSVDVVLGDAALNNVPEGAMAGVLGEIARVTRSSGLILLRQIVLPDAPVAAYEFAEARRRLRAGEIDLHAFDRILRFYAFNEVAFDPARHAVDARRVFTAVRAKFDAGALTKTEFGFLMQRYSEVCHTVFPVREQQRLLGYLGRCEVEHLPERVAYRELMAVFAIEAA